MLTKGPNNKLLFVCIGHKGEKPTSFSLPDNMLILTNVPKGETIKQNWDGFCCHDDLECYLGMMRKYMQEHFKLDKLTVLAHLAKLMENDDAD